MPYASTALGHLILNSYHCVMQAMLLSFCQNIRITFDCKQAADGVQCFFLAWISHSASNIHLRTGLPVNPLEGFTSSLYHLSLYMNKLFKIVHVNLNNSLIEINYILLPADRGIFTHIRAYFHQFILGMFIMHLVMHLFTVLYFDTCTEWSFSVNTEEVKTEAK